MSSKFVGRTHALIFASVIAVAAACSGGGGDDFITPCCGNGNGGTDLTPPTVASVTPATGTPNVPTTATITIVFSENVDSASVTNTAIVLSPGITGTIVVSGATAVFTPAPGLPPNTVVTGTVSNVRDRSGNVMAAPFTFNFTTTP